jgi:bile acid-coenzyme A ligase
VTSSLAPVLTGPRADPIVTSVPVRPIGEVLDDLARERPDAPALTIGSSTLTRAEVASRTNQTARWLGGAGAHPQGLVAVVLPNGAALVEVVIATWKLGATPLILPEKMPNLELDAIIDLARPELVVGRPGSDPPASLAGLDDSRLTPRTPKWWRATVSGGSTGRPKLIISSRPGVADPDERTMYLRRDGCTVIPGPLYHGAPFLVGFWSLFRGCHLVLLDRFSPESALAALDLHRARYTLMVPTMMSRIWKLPEEVKAATDLNSLEVLLHLGAACPPWLKQAWIDWIGPSKVHELYAGTEGQAMTWIRGDEWLDHRGSVGRPVGGAAMAAFDPSHNRLPPGEIGEIFMKPPSGAPATYEYVGADKREVDGWESLGDMGSVDADGYVYIADRRTDMVVSGGANVYPAEVEQAIDEHPDVVTSAVIGLPDDDLGNRVHAVVEARPWLDAAALAAFLAERVVRYKIPRTFEFTTEPLRDEQGKVRRAALREERIEATRRAGG